MGFSFKKICITTYIIINNLTTISIEHMYYLIKSYVKYISYIVYEKRFVTFFSDHCRIKGNQAGQTAKS